MVVVDPFLIKVSMREDQAGYDVHIGFYAGEEKGMDAFRVMMCTRLLREERVLLVPYAFEQWDPEHRELTTFKSEFANWKEMLEFSKALGESTPALKEVLEKEAMDEFIHAGFAFLYKNHLAS